MLMAIINGKVYNLPRHGFKHPGGADLYQLAHGNDVTALVYSYHNKPLQILNRIKKHECSESLVDAPPLYSFDSKFYDHIKSVANRYFEKNKIKRKDVLYLRTLVLLILTLIFYILSLTLSPFFSPVFGICLACIGLCIQHDANHGAFSASPRINHIMGLMDDLIGGSSFIWRYQHNLFHHSYCNDPNLDQDTKSAYPWIRFNQTQSHLPHMKYQHLYALFLYSFMGILVFFTNIRAFVTQKCGQANIQGIRRQDKIEFILMKVLYIIYQFIIPFLFFKWSFIWKFYLPVQLFGGFYLALLFSVSHNNQQVVKASQIKTNKWAVLQLVTSANWSSNSWFWNIMSGGLNCQIEHHLFPGISHRHYPIMHRIIKRACCKFNLPYNHYDSFTSIVLDHLRLLKILSFKNIAN